MSQQYHSKCLRFASFELDLETRELSRDGRRLQLQDKPAKVLCLLVSQPGNLLTRDEIQKTVLPDTFVDIDHAINTAIKKIREVLEDDPKEPRLIETRPQMGYRFIGTVDEVRDERAIGEPDLPMDASIS